MMAKKFINKFPFSSFPPTNILCSSMEDELSKSVRIFWAFHCINHRSKKNLSFCVCGSKCPSYHLWSYSVCASHRGYVQRLLLHGKSLSENLSVGVQVSALLTPLAFYSKFSRGLLATDYVRHFHEYCGFSPLLEVHCILHSCKSACRLFCAWMDHPPLTILLDL